MAESFPPLHEITTGSFIVPFSPQRHRDTESQSSKAATKLKSFGFSSRAWRLRGESPAQDSPRSREEREDFAKKNPFLPAKHLRVSSPHFLVFFGGLQVSRFHLTPVRVGKPFGYPVAIHRGLR